MNAPLRLPQSDVSVTPLLSFQDVRKSYPTKGDRDRMALDGISLDFPVGEVVAIIGSSGSGKSTIAQIAAGLEQPTHGRVLIDGVDMHSACARTRRGIAIVVRDPDLPPHRTVRDIVAERRDASGAELSDTPGALDRLFELIGLNGDADRYADELSDGGRRRAALARALAGSPRLLILDEATSALAPEIAEDFLSTLARVNAESGITVLLITHDMAAVTALATRVCVLDGGRVVEEGPTARVFARPNHPVTRRFAAAATGATLPPFIVDKISETPSPRGRALIRLAFEGPGATQPVLTNVARELGFDLGILAGSLGAAGGEPYGVLIVAAPSDEPYFTAVIERLEDAGLGVEMLGFVA